MTRCATLVLALAVVTVILTPSNSWRRRRRRQFICKRTDCKLSQWSAWAACSRTCKEGTTTRTRKIVYHESCGGSCPSHPLNETRSCNIQQCCPVDCAYSWSAWSACTGCGISTKFRTPIIKVLNWCNGKVCPGKEIRSCKTGKCCPVNCVTDNWSSWSGCSAACEQNGKRVRTRSVITQSSCNGTPCGTLRESKSCRGPCCPRDCQVTNWSSWGKCIAPKGRCSVNSGTETRSRNVTSQPSCGGKPCPSLSQSKRCTPVPIPCKMNSWSSWSPCTPLNGKCGPGTQYQTRSVATQPYCSVACPASRQTRSCKHSCCPVDCVVSTWTAWSACSTTCGTGSRTRTRNINTQPSCGGKSCPAQKETKSCSQYNNRDCVMSLWTAWSLCSNSCGSGTSTRTRTIKTTALCRGKACGARTESKPCTDFRDNRDCVVNSWGSWGACSEKCAVGSKQRTRTIKITKRCQGRDCPALQNTTQCGTPNNGCLHKCSNGVCSCNNGYYLATDRKNCIAKDCKMPKPSYCAPGTALGSTCKHALVTCPGNKTTYSVTCSLGCPKDYSIKGASKVTCQTSGQWSTYATSYCRRNNDPPSQIVLSGSATIQENKPRGTKLGTFSSVDSNNKDQHTYSIVSGGRGKFELRGADLYTLVVFDYESLPNQFTLTIRSTDNGSPPMKLDKIFKITVADVNEKPTAIQLSGNTVDENSDVDTILGVLSTTDLDNGQTYSYSLLDSAGGRFKIQGNFVKVGKSNKNCMLNGGSQCFLNYESVSSYSIVVRSVDSGSPSLSINASFNISVNDVNDQPRGLQLSNYKVSENASINTIVGNLSATDEDAGQKLSFSLVDDDNGRFGLDNNGGIYKAKSTDYETSKVHYIVVNVTDNGQPPKAMTRNFSIIVLDVNEAPVSIELTRTSVLENTRLGTVVGSLSAKDNDAVQFLTFKLDEDSAGKFSLQSNVTCQNSSLGGTVCATNLLVNGDINYEDTSSLDIIVRVTDEKGLFHTEMFNVTVINENDPPTNVTLDGSDSASVAENSINVQIDTLLTDDEDQGQRFTYVLSRNPGGNFEIRGDKLFASRNATLDFESSPSYQIKVISTDNGSPPKSIEVTLVVNLQDVNEKPTDIQLSNNSVQENRLAGAVIGQLSVRDPDRQQGHVCSITDSANGKVGINNNKITVGSAGIDYEEASSFNLTVLCRDPGGLTVEKSFVILVQDINEAPTNIALSNDKVQENKKGGITVAQLNVTDPDNVKAQVQSVSFSILSSNPNLPFQIQNDALVTTRGLNFENTAQWTFRIKATDDGRPVLSRTQTVTIQVIDVNDAPDGLTLSSSSVNENSDSDTLVGTLTALDQDTSQNHTFQLLDSASGRFNVDGNQIKVAVRNTQCLNYGGSSCLLNYEVQKRYVIRVKTTDDGSPPLSFEKDFGIDIRDVNDKPRDLQLSSNKVKEDAKKNTLIGRFSSRDEDANQTLTYSLKNDDSGRFKVDSLGNLYKANDTDYETQTKHTITAVVTDSGNPSLKMEKLFTIEVLNVNEAPVNINITSQGGQLYFPDGHPQVRENSPLGTVIGMLEALDHDANQTLSFKLDDDAGGKFTLGPSANCQTITNISGVNTKCTIGLRVNGDLDFELSNEYHVTVRVTDAKGLFTAEQLRISIVDENDAPENITLGGSYSVRVYENANGSLVGQLVTSDEDVAQAHTYKLLDDAAGRFVILNDKLYVSLAAKLDFEGQNNFTVKVRSTDSGSPSLSVEQVFEISILDVNEAPVNISLAPANVTENSQPGTRIGQLTVSDPDNYGPRGTLQTHSCQVTGSNIGKFTIQSNVLALGGASLDYELTPVTRVQVKCTDNGSPPLSLVRDLSINVNDVNEAPTSISLSSDAIDENQPPFLIGFFSTADPDNANQPTNRQTFTYKLMGDTAGFPFVIDGDSLNSTRSLDYEAQRSWNITVQSVDSGNPQLSVVTDFLISVIDVNERPFNITLSNTVVDENCPQDTVVGNLLSLDPDRSQTHTYTMVNSAGGRFKLAGKQLKVAMSNVDCLKNGGDFCKLNYEKKGSYTVKVRVTDNGSPRLSSEASMVISLNDINDRPNDFRLSSRTVKENATVGTKIGRFTATDEDQFQTLTFSLLNSDGGRFAIDSTGYLFKAKKTDYETSKAHKIVAQVTDNGTVPLNNNKTFIVVVENINEPPINMTLTSTSGQQSFTDNKPRVNENSAANATVGTLQAFDHDEVQSLTFSLDDDANGKFTAGSHVTCHNNTNIPGVKTMCTALLQVSGDLNYEASHSEDIVVRVTDPSGLFHIQPLQVVILDVNDRPSNITLAGGDTASINENVNGGYVGDLVATDEDFNQTHRYTWINNGGWKFRLRSNKIYASSYANLDYEAKSTYIIRVRSTDDGSPRLNIDKTFTVKVLDVNERPTDILLSSRNVLENSHKGTVVGNISVLDPDDMGPRGPWQNHSCRVLNPSSTPFKVNGTDNILVVDGDLNYEKLDSYSIDIRCHDNANPPLSVDKNFKINVIDVNEKPYDITISNNEVAENTGIVTVGSLDTADPDNELTVVQTFTYTIDAASGSVPFAAVHGLLNTTRSLDYEANSTWSLTIKSTDNEGLTTTKNFSIIVKDTNDPPTGVSASGPLSVNENSQTGEYIGSLTTSDQDVGQTHQYQILNVFAQGHRNQSSSSNLHNLFSIESPSGRITLQKPGLDYELYANYTVTVNSTDSGFPPYSILASFVVSVNNTNEQPQSIFLSGNQVPENSPVDTVVGDLSIYDPDNIHLPLQKFQCSVVNDKPFKVVNHLTLVVSKNTLDYETVDTYTVNVNCTELLPNPFSVSSLFVINIQDVNEAPYNLTISANKLNENGPPGVVVGTLSVHDPDLPSSGRANVSLALKYQTPGPVAFTLNGSRLVTTRKLNFETQDSYKVTVVATDSGNPPLNTSLTFTIQVIDVNDPPTAVKLVSNGIYENATAGTIVGVLQATDQDADQSHTFVVTGYGSDWFFVNGSSLRLKGTPLNYETTPVMNITILVLDNGSPPLSYKGNVSVMVLDSNDRPSDIIFNSSLSVTDSTSYQIVIPENSPSGTSLMNLSVVDEDFGQQHSCELVAGRNYFIISSASKSTSEITLKEGADLNYETLLDTLLKVSVECRDDGSPPYSIQKNFSVQVSDVNEAPYDIRLNGSTVVEENVRVGYAVGYLTCEDPDIGQSHMFTVIGNYSSVFEVNNSYNLVVKDPSHLDYENLHPNLVLTVAIQVTDNPVKGTGAPLKAIGNVTISITDINEAPHDIRLVPANVTVPENVSVGYCLAQIASRNPEKLQTVVYTLLNYQSMLSIEDVCKDNSYSAGHQDDGLPYLIVNSHLSYNDYVVQGYQILIEAEDNGIPPQTFNETVQIHVTKIDPCPQATCHVDATCSRVDWQNYTCACNAGYSGNGFNCQEIDECNITCTEVDECIANPCSNGGTCHDFVNYYNCTCPSGYNNGTDCTFINFCSSSPCMNDATCNPVLNGYNCLCPCGFTGKHCETNIDDCVHPKKCFEGSCIDKNNSFICECEPQFFGPQCRRMEGECTKKPCGEQEICIPRNVERYNTTFCVSVDALVSLPFPEDVISNPYKHYRLERWFFTNEQQFPLSEITNNDDDSGMVSVTDVYVRQPSWEHPSKAKRSLSEENLPTLDFVVLVYLQEQEKYMGVPSKIVLCKMNKTCAELNYPKTETKTDFEYELCIATAWEVKKWDTEWCVSKEAKERPLRSSLHKQKMNLYYVIAGIGGILLIVLITGLTLCRRNTLIARERKFMKQQRFTERRDTYIDNMHRHQRANQEMEALGTVNPIYGNEEQEVTRREVARQINVMDNPLYEAPGEIKAKRSEPSRGFNNPMYVSFQPPQPDEKKTVREEEAEEACAAVGFANPMFASHRQEKKTSEQKQDDSGIYAVPVQPDKPAKRERKTPIYDTPTKPTQPVNEEPVVSGGPGFFNPLYQTRREEEEFPSDISSIFAPPSKPTGRTLDDDLGQSDC